MMVTYLKADQGDSHEEINDTRGCHSIFSFFETLYRDHLIAVMEADDDDAHAMYHKGRALRVYLIFLVVTSIFMDKSTTYIDVIYLIYFINLERIYEYN